MTISALDNNLSSIMDDLEKSAQTPEGGVRAAYLVREVDALGKLWTAPETRPKAQEVLQSWSAGDGLKKRIADHWIDRAKSIVEGGVAPVGKEKKVHPVLARFRALNVTTGHKARKTGDTGEMR